MADLYQKRNIPRVIFSIHSLSRRLFENGGVKEMATLVPNFNFPPEQLEAALESLAKARFVASGPQPRSQRQDAEPPEDQGGFQALGLFFPPSVCPLTRFKALC